MAGKSIQCLKLSTGEELIAELERDNNADAYILYNPIYVQMTPKQDGSGLSLMMSVQFLMYSKSRKFIIPVGSVITVFEPTPEVADAYRTNHGSGLTVVAGNTDLAGVAKSLILG